MLRHINIVFQSTLIHSVNFGPLWSILVYLRMGKDMFGLKVVILNPNLLKNIDLKLISNSIKF